MCLELCSPVTRFLYGSISIEKGNAVKKRLRFIILCLLLALPAAAAAQEFQSRSAAPAVISNANDPNLSSLNVLTCERPADCVVFNPPCRSPIAVNTTSYPALLAWRRAAAFRFGCGFQNFGSTYATDCIGGYCALRAAPDSHAAGADNNPKFCETDAACTVATGSCGQKVAVNIRHHAFKQAALDIEPACQTVMDDRPVISSQCSYSTCTVTLDNHPE